METERNREAEELTEREREKESDSPLLSRLLLMATNLIICLHSGCWDLLPHLLSCFTSLSYSHSSLVFLSPSPSPEQALLLSNPQRGGPWSADSAPDSGGVKSRASLSGKWPWMETNWQKSQSPPILLSHCVSHTNSSFLPLCYTVPNHPHKIHRSAWLVWRGPHEL